MKLQVKYCLIFFSFLVFVCQINAQANEFCPEENLNPVMTSPSDRLPFIYGQIRLIGFPSDKKLPKITVLLMDTQSSASRLTVDRSGKYCLRLRTKSGGTLIVEVNGVEAERRNVSSLGFGQQREDFEIYHDRQEKTPAPESFRQVFYRSIPKPPSFTKKLRSRKQENIDKAIEYLTQIVTIDPLVYRLGEARRFVSTEENAFRGEAAFKNRSN